MKTCSRCGEKKSVSEFYRQKDKGDGYSSRCRTCTREVTFEHNSGHPLKRCACGCGEMIPSIDRWGKKRRYVNGHYRRGRGGTRDITGSKNPQWKGGRIVSGDGYVYVRSPGHPNATIHGYVLEHRLAMERKLGRLLRRDEIVHHRNGIPDDNRIENLEAMTIGEHTSLHRRIRQARMKASNPDTKIGREQGESHAC